MFQLRLKPLIKQHENIAFLPVFLCFYVMKRFPALGTEPSSGEVNGKLPLHMTMSQKMSGL